ncbi:MAG: HEAT repeat domain-containing protein [Candidatus Binatia bacterium]
MAGKKAVAADHILENLLTLAREGAVEHRCAALLVLGALKLQDDSVVEMAGAALQHPNVVLRDYALRYFEEAQPKAGLPLLLPLLNDGEKDVQDRVVRLLPSFGPAVVRPLLQQAPTLARPGQLHTVRALCTVRGRGAWKGLLQLLSQGDTEFNKTACDTMTVTLREMAEQEQDDLYAEVETFAATLDEQAQRPAVLSAIRLLGQLGRPQARKRLLGFVSADHHHSLRFHALVALLHCLRGQELHKGELARLLPLLEEPEFSDTMRLTLELLESHSLPVEYQPVLSRLVQSPHVAVQKFALRKLGEFDSPAVVRTLLHQLGDLDYARREAAVRSLRKIPAARNALVKEFLACEDASKAWVIAEMLPTYEGKWRRDTLDDVWTRLQAAIEAQDRIQGAYLHFLKSVDVEDVYARLVERGTQLKKAKKYQEAIRFFSLLKEFPAFQADHRFLLALAQLKLHAHDLTSVARRHEPALDLLADLYRSSAFPLLESLKKEKSLEPEDLFYVGFCLAESSGKERTLGGDILEFLAARYPRTKIGQSAKNKLRLL